MNQKRMKYKVYGGKQDLHLHNITLCLNIRNIIKFISNRIDSNNDDVLMLSDIFIL